MNSIQNKLPFEYDDQVKHQEYYEELGKFIERYSERQLSDFDHYIIGELADEVVQPRQKATMQNFSNLKNRMKEQRISKWD